MCSFIEAITEEITLKMSVFPHTVATDFEANTTEGVGVLGASGKNKNLPGSSNHFSFFQHQIRSYLGMAALPFFSLHDRLPRIGRFHEVCDPNAESNNSTGIGLEWWNTFEEHLGFKSIIQLGSDTTIKSTMFQAVSSIFQLNHHGVLLFFWILAFFDLLALQSWLF